MSGPSFCERFRNKILNRGARAREGLVLPDDALAKMEADWVDDPDLDGDAPFVATRDEEAYRPLKAGCSLSHIGHPGPGTLGCFVRERHGDPNRIFLLSNYHVLMAGGGLWNGQPSDHIIQPANMFRDQAAQAEDFIVAEYVDGYYGEGLDAGLAELAEGVAWSNTTPQGVRLNGTDRVKVGDSVWKYGAASRRTQGIVTAIGLQTRRLDPHTHEWVEFPNQIEVTTIDKRQTAIFQSAGDSGAVLCNARNRIVGLLHSGGGVRALATPIYSVFDRLNIEFAPRPNPPPNPE